MIQGLQDDKAEFEKAMAGLQASLSLFPTPLAQAASRVIGEGDPYSYDCFQFSKNMAELVIKMLYASLYPGAAMNNSAEARKSLLDVINTGNWKGGFESLPKAGFGDQFRVLSNWAYSKKKENDDALLTSFYQLDPILKALNKSPRQDRKVVDLLSRIIEIRNAPAHGADGADFRRIANIPLLKCVHLLAQSCPATTQWQWVCRFGADAKLLQGPSPRGVQSVSGMPEGMAISADIAHGIFFSVPPIIVCNREATDFFVLNEKADKDTHVAEFLNYGRSLSRVDINLTSVIKGQGDSVNLPASATTVQPVFVAPDHAATEAPIGTRPARVEPKNIPDTVPEPIERKELVASVLSARADQRIQIITGPTGTGKTELAKGIAGQIQQEYDIAWWINIGETGVSAKLCIDESISQLLATLGRPADDLPKAISGKRALFILDDLPEPSDAKSFLSAAKTADILITSTNPTWRKYGRVHEIGIFTTAEAIAFVKQRVDTTDESHIGALIAELGCLPLALEQAASFIEARSLTINNFLALFQQCSPQILADSKTTDSHAPLAVSLSMVRENLKASSPSAARIFNLLCFTHPENIPLALFRRSLEGFPEDIATVFADEMLLEECIANLRKYSLVQRTNASLTIHRLVQRLSIESMQQEEKVELASASLTLFRHIYSANGRDPRAWAAVSWLFPYALQTFNEANRLGVVTPDSISLLLNLARILSDQHQLDAAEALYQQALAILPESTENKSAKVAILEGLAVRCAERADFEQARKLHQQALALLGDPNEPAYPTVLNNLAGTAYSQACFDEAIKHRSEALRLAEINQSIPLEDHGRILHSLGMDYLGAGDEVRAERTLKKALDYQRTHLPDDHPDIAVTLNHLGNFYQHKKKTARAEQCLREAMNVLDKGGYDIDFVRALVSNNLAGLLYQKGKIAEAKALLERAIGMFQIFGSISTDAAEAMYLLGAIYIDTGQFKESEHLLVTALKIYQQLHAPASFSRHVIEELILLYERTLQNDKVAFFRKQLSTMGK